MLKVLPDMTRPIKKLIPQRRDQKPNRNWIRPPNTMVHKGKGNSPQKLSYWTDDNNQVKLYSQKELATCNILTNLNVILVRALVLLDILKTLDEDTKVGNLINQDYASFKTTKTSIFNRFIDLMAAVPDITFGEFLGFISTTSDPQEYLTMGKKTIKQVIKAKSKQVTNFYTSDRFREN